MSEEGTPNAPRVVVSVSTWQNVLNDAEELLALAEDHASLSRSLAACVVVMLVATLAQAVETEYSTSEHFNPGAVAKSRGWGLENRIKKLATIRGDRRDSIDHDHPARKDIAELIRVRNGLVHVNEPAWEVETSAEPAAVPGLDKVLRGTPWRLVEPRVVRRYLAAVKVYLQEVVDGDKEKIELGDWLPE